MSILILYGSETGTAEDVAETLRRESEMRHLSARVFGLDEFEIDNLKSESIVLFIVSTTGQGEMPPNMRSAWRFLLKKSHKSDFLENMSFSVLGLGDSSYQKYNFAGKKIYRRMIQLGSKPLANLALADDQHELGIDAAFQPWKLEIFQKIYKLQIFEKMTEEIDFSVKLQPKYRFSKFEDDFLAENSENQDYHCLKVVSNQRVTSESHFQETRLVKFEISENDSHIFAYKPGDVLMIRPENPEETLKIALEALGWDDEILDEKVIIRKNSEYAREPMNYIVGVPTTIRTCLKKYFDLQQIPKRSFFEVLAHLTSDPIEKERLAELSSPQGLDDLLDYSTRCRRTIAETLRDFPTTSRNLQPDQLFDFLTTIRPRAFSIASRPNLGYIELLVAKVEYKSRMADRRRGLCSTYIARLQPGDQVFSKIRTGTFKFPAEGRRMICVGPGTGVAPFRSLFGSLEDQGMSNQGILFFGCRGKNQDNYFEKEWEKMTSVEVVTAFSRDTAQKVYVQHKILENAKKVWEILRDDGMVFVAGSAGEMPKAVGEAIDEIARKIGGEQEEGWIAKAEAKGRIQYETWS